MGPPARRCGPRRPGPVEPATEVIEVTEHDDAAGGEDLVEDSADLGRRGNLPQQRTVVAGSQAVDGNVTALVATLAGTVDSTSKPDSTSRRARTKSWSR